MSEKDFLKVTCHYGQEAYNFYTVLAGSMEQLRKECDTFLFQKRKLELIKYRLYWIDEANDEIELIDDTDFAIYKIKGFQVSKGQVHLAKWRDESKENGEQRKSPSTAGSPNTDDPSNFAIHEQVECDSCHLKPIVGFRYKCVQCPNYDLCQRCEAAHVHADHMMVRMPHEGCPSIVEAWISGRAARRNRRRPYCPFVSAPGEAPQEGSRGSKSASDSPGEKNTSESHHRRHSARAERYHLRNSIFSNLYNMMHDLAEGGVPPPNEEAVRKDVKKAAKELAKCAQAAGVEVGKAATMFSNTIGSAACATEASAPVEKQAAPTSEAPVTPKVVTEPAKAAESASINSPDTTDDTPATPVQSQQQQTATSASIAKETPPTAPVLPPALMENLSQIIDPQYMKAGIEILNNFNEMFAKMLISENDANEQREKGDEDAEEPEDTQKVDESVAGAASTGTIPKVVTPTTPAARSTSISPSTSSAPSLSENAVDTDWQLIDDTHSTPIATNAGWQATGPTPATGAIKKGMDYKELGKYLQAHVEEEIKRDQDRQRCNESATAAASPNGAKTGLTIPGGSAKKQLSEETRDVAMIHPDERINNAIQVMISMGFSNEGNCLTQLLESVNGNISAALDLMNVAQRQN